MRLFLLIVLFIATQSLFAQEIKKKLNEIREEYKQINSYTNYRIDTVVFFGESTEGAELWAFYDSTNKLKKLQITYLGEMGKRVEEFYLKNNRVIFVYTLDYEYNRPIYWDQKVAKENGDNEVFDYTKAVITKNRYYFDDQQTLIRWLSGMKEEKEAIKEKEEAIVKELERLKSRLQ